MVIPIQIRLGTKKHLHAIDVPIKCGVVQGRAFLSILTFHIGTCVQQPTHAFKFTLNRMVLVSGVVR